MIRSISLFVSRFTETAIKRGASKSQLPLRGVSLVALSAAASACLSPLGAQAQTVVKVFDFINGLDGLGLGTGASVPQCHFTPVGTNLWFTSQLGGGYGFGGIFSFDPTAGTVSQLANLDNNTGNKPWSSSVMLAGGKAWFTTSVGGTGNKGSLCSIETNFPYTVNNAFSFPTNATYGFGPHSTPIQIGDDLWFTTSSGGIVSGTNTTFGTIVKYNLTSNTLTNVLSLDSYNYGRQPLGSGLTKVGDDYYYLTYSGGTNIVSGSTPTGAGVLGKLSFGSSNQPVITKVIDLPGGALAFPPGDVVADGTNALYFTTVGGNANPGAIAKFDVQTRTLTSLFTFKTNAADVAAYGKQPYGTPVLYNNELYYTTLSGGSIGKGVLAKLNLANNTVTKLADFEQAGGLALGASPQYNGATLYTNPVSGRICTYWAINRGGVTNSTQALGSGTIIRVDLPPPPLTLTSSNTRDGNLLLTWTGGYTPYSVDRKDDLSSAQWTTNHITNLSTNAVSIPASEAQGFFRVRSPNQ